MNSVGHLILVTANIHTIIGVPKNITKILFYGFFFKCILSRAGTLNFKTFRDTVSNQVNGTLEMQETFKPSNTMRK